MCIRDRTSSDNKILLYMFTTSKHTLNDDAENKNKNNFVIAYLCNKEYFWNSFGSIKGLSSTDTPVITVTNETNQRTDNALIQ